MTASPRRLRRAQLRALPSYLVVAEAERLDELRLGLALLPICARGRVIVEAARGAEVAEIELPARMTLTVVRRGEDAGPGSAAVLAARAWASEMLCGEDRVSVWLAGGGAIDAELGACLVRDYGLPASALLAGDAFLT